MAGTKFTADFETTTDVNDCRVWAFAMSEIGNPDNFIYGKSIDEFFDLLEGFHKSVKIWFHNLKFDGSFIINWLLRNGFEYRENKKDCDTGTFTTLITDMGVYYSIEVYFRRNKHKTQRVVFYDSLKILNFSVEQIAKDFNLPIRKLSLDYKATREIGHELTPEEVDYIRNDVEIMSRALNIMFEEGLTKMTIGSDALANYKEFNTNFNKYFPVFNMELDAEIRKSYKGGFTWLNDIYKEKTVGKGVVFDVNSMYPAQMVRAKLPFGEPISFEGEYKEDKLYDLYVIAFTAIFDLKEGKIPSIQIKHNPSFIPNEYVKTTNGMPVDLVLTRPDFELFKQQYNIEEIRYIGGWKFKGIRGLFDDYINYWINQKIESKKEGNSAKTRIAKLMLNSLYGKTGLNPISVKKYPYLQDGVLKFGFHDREEREPIYIPAATFITSYARRFIIQSAQAVRDWSLAKYGEDYMIYTDTDSLHIRINNEEEDVAELSKIIDIDDYKLGYWKLESRFDRGSYIRQKCYIEEDYNKVLNVTMAGFPKYLAPLITFDNFKLGYTTEGLTVEDMIEIAKGNGATPEQIERIHPKLRYHQVKGGVVLEDTDFTIK